MPLVCCLALVLLGGIGWAESPLLRYVDRHNIEHKKRGLTEPSGLSLAADGQGLWTVSDDSKRVFYLGLDGELANTRSFKTGVKGLEGVAAEPSGRWLYVVKEESNEIIRFALATGTLAQRQPLNAMQGYETELAQLFAGSANKGLEGIAWNAARETLFVLKEGEPGLLLEIAPDLQTILGYRRLDASNGFVAPEGEIDYSGLACTPDGKALWIVSDQARRLFHYDLVADRVRQSWPLAYERKGDAKRVKKAEGIALDPALQRLYVVSDEEARLYIFDLRPAPR